MANARARSLRVNMTDAEKRLWSVLRSRRLQNYKFRRQRPVGPYILDFACLAHHIAVEADGGQHADNADDIRRTEWLVSQGWRILRFWNHDILENAEESRQLFYKPWKNPHPPTLTRGSLPLPHSGRGDKWAERRLP